MKMICPHCHQEIIIDTYYSRHKKQILEKHRQMMQNTEYAQRRRETALKSYYKRKQSKND